MSNVIDINELRKKAESISKPKDLKAFIEAQHELIGKLQRDLIFLQDKLKDAERLLLSAPKTQLSVSPEEMICIEQIEMLRNRSYGRELSLDEVKRLDLLVKNLRLIREQSTQVLNTTAYEHIKEDELLSIAAKSEDR
jgi:predicted nucleotidyltransferase component of viral defense system